MYRDFHLPYLDGRSEAIGDPERSRGRDWGGAVRVRLGGEYWKSPGFFSLQDSLIWKFF